MLHAGKASVERAAYRKSILKVPTTNKSRSVEARAELSCSFLLLTNISGGIQILGVGNLSVQSSQGK